MALLQWYAIFKRSLNWIQMKCISATTNKVCNCRLEKIWKVVEDWENWLAHYRFAGDFHSYHAIWVVRNPLNFFVLFFISDGLVKWRPARPWFIFGVRTEKHEIWGKYCTKYEYLPVHLSSFFPSLVLSSFPSSFLSFLPYFLSTFGGRGAPFQISSI